jgi:hypothetical protein
LIADFILQKLVHLGAVKLKHVLIFGVVVFHLDDLRWLLLDTVVFLAVAVFRVLVCLCDILRVLGIV